MRYLSPIGSVWFPPKLPDLTYDLPEPELPKPEPQYFRPITVKKKTVLRVRPKPAFNFTPAATSELKEKILKLVRRGFGSKQIAATLGVTKALVDALFSVDRG